MGMGPEEPDLEVDQSVQLLDWVAGGLVEDPVKTRHELLAATNEDLTEEIVLVLEERVHRPN